MAAGFAIGSFVGPIGSVVGTLVGGIVGRYKGKQLGTKVFEDMEDRRERDKNKDIEVSQKLQLPDVAGLLSDSDSENDYEVEYQDAVQEQNQEEHELEEYLRSLRTLGVKDSQSDAEITDEFNRLTELVCCGD
jgi:phage tail tape-measure protein